MPRRSRCSAALDRASVRGHPSARFALTKMVDANEEMYARLVAGKRGPDVGRWDPQRIDATLTRGTGL